MHMAMAKTKEQRGKGSRKQPRKGKAKNQPQKAKEKTQKKKRKLTKTQIVMLKKKLRKKPHLLTKILLEHGVRGNFGKKTLAELRSSGRKSVVPWMSKMEWDTVRSGLFSFKIEDQVTALNRISAWKSRCHPRIPLGIEVTAALVRAKVEDAEAKKLSNAQYQHDDIIMLYSMALIRFVNLVTEIGQQNDHNTPISVLAKRMGIPDWLVELRHEATHSTIPSLPTVRLGTALALEWIKVHYWEAESPKIQDLIKKPFEPLKECVGNPERVHNLLRAYKATHGQVRGSFPKDLDPETVREEISQALAADKHLFLEGLMKEGILVPPGDHTYGKSVHKIQTLSDDKLEMWLPLLKIISDASAMPDFLQIAIKELASGKGASCRLLSWVHLLLSALTWEELTEMTECVEKLQFIRKTPQKLNWKKLLPVALKNPCTATPRLLPMLFALNPCGARQKVQIEKVVSIYCSRDLREELTNATTQDYRRIEDIGVYYKTEFKETSWELCSSNVNWGLYPLGLLPSQIGAEVLNLDLPSSVDNLYRHKVQSWQRVQPSLGIQGSSNEDKSEDCAQMETPNLRARLLMVQHQRLLPYWSETEIQEISKGLVIF